MDGLNTVYLNISHQACLCIPNEEEMEVYAATQFTDITQMAIAQVLNIPEKK
jgi:xanthine dehydrogenase molybdopterin-binding subunit B